MLFTMTQFSSTTLGALRQSVDSACADPEKDIPGSTMVVVDRDGRELFAHCAGKREVSGNEPMTHDNIY